MGSYRQVYQCDVPPNCAVPLEAAEAFFAGSRVRHLKRTPTKLEFERGSKWKSWAAICSERSVQRQVTVTLAAGAERPVLQCEYHAFYPYPTAHFAPWHFAREVNDLEHFLAQWHNLREADPTLPAGAAAQQTHEDRQRDSLYRRSIGSRFNPGIYLLYRLYRLATWLTHVIRRRFTILGRALLGAVWVAITTAFDVDGASGYQAVVPLAGVLFIAMVFGFRFRAKFDVERKLARVASVGEPFRYRVSVTNRTSRRQTGLLLLDDLADPRPPFREWRDFKLDQDRHVRPFRFERRQLRSPFKFATPAEGALPPLLPGERRDITLELTPLRRGVMRFAGVTIARPDPLGIFRALRRMRLPQSVLVLPARYVIPPIALPGQLRYQPGGVALAAHIGQSEEFVALRDYRRGDPPRHIHWRSWAKAGRPIVKEFEDEFFVRHALVLDTFTPRPFSDAFEEAVAVASSFACAVLTQESLLDLLFVGAEAYSFTAGRGLAHADQMLEILAAVQPCRTLPFRSLEALVLNHAKSVGGCICVLLAWDEPRQRFVQKLRAMGQPVLVFVIRAPGATPPLAPGPMSDVPEWFHELEIGKVAAQLAALK